MVHAAAPYARSVVGDVVPASDRDDVGTVRRVVAMYSIGRLLVLDENSKIKTQEMFGGAGTRRRPV